MIYSIVSTSERPDLAAVTATWRWEAFYRKYDHPLDEVIAEAQRTAGQALAMPRTLVLLADDEPVGTASLTAHDLDERPELTPWLAGVYVVPHARGRGDAGRLVAAVENEAAANGVRTLWLYTNTAERIYQRAGWRTTEIVQRKGKPYAVMRRDLESDRFWLNQPKP